MGALIDFEKKSFILLLTSFQYGSLLENVTPTIYISFSPDIICPLDLQEG